MRGDPRACVEQFLLVDVLPEIANRAAHANFNSADTCEVLALLSHCESSPTIVKHSLLQLSEIISRDPCKKRDEDAGLKMVECAIRKSIVDTTAIFDAESFAQQTLRLKVYSQIIALINVYSAKDLIAKNLRHPEGVAKVVDKMRELLQGKDYKRQNPLRYAMKSVMEGLKRLKSGDSEQLKDFLQLYEKLFMADISKEKIVKDLVNKYQNYRSKNGWYDLHIIMQRLANKVSF